MLRYRLDALGSAVAYALALGAAVAGTFLAMGHWEDSLAPDEDMSMAGLALLPVIAIGVLGVPVVLASVVSLVLRSERGVRIGQLVSACLHLPAAALSVSILSGVSRDSTEAGMGWWAAGFGAAVVIHLAWLAWAVKESRRSERVVVFGGE